MQCVQYADSHLASQSSGKSDVENAFHTRPIVTHRIQIFIRRIYLPRRPSSGPHSPVHFKALMNKALGNTQNVLASGY